MEYCQAVSKGVTSSSDILCDRKKQEECSQGNMPYEEHASRLFTKPLEVAIQKMQEEILSLPSSKSTGLYRSVMNK